MKYLDLTREINNETQVCPCDRTPVVEDYATTGEEGVNVKFLKMGTHTSTHIDAPYHISSEGKTLNDYAIERFIGKGALLDFSHKGAVYPITEHDILDHKELLSSVDFAILNTGWAKHYGTWEFFKHPYLTEGAALALVSLGIKIVATDGSSADAAYGFSTAKRLENPTFSEILENIERENIKDEAHHALLGNDCLIVEYLCNLDQVQSEIGEYSFLPLKIEKADGSPIRAICKE